MVQFSDKNFKPLWSVRSGRVTKRPCPFLPLSKDDGLRDIGMSVENRILAVNSVTVSYLIHYDSLLQNATDIIQNATAILLQNATFITNCDSTRYLDVYENFL